MKTKNLQLHDSGKQETYTPFNQILSSVKCGLKATVVLARNCNIKMLIKVRNAYQQWATFIKEINLANEE